MRLKTAKTKLFILSFPSSFFLKVFKHREDYFSPFFFLHPRLSSKHSFSAKIVVVVEVVASPVVDDDKVVTRSRRMGLLRQRSGRHLRRLRKKRVLLYV